MMLVIGATNTLYALHGRFIADVTTQRVTRIGRVDYEPAAIDDGDGLLNQAPLRVVRVDFEELVRAVDYESLVQEVIDLYVLPAVDAMAGLDPAREEAARCMSCGLCFDCEQCFMYCNAGGFTRIEKASPGHYYALALDACEGCGKCIELCPCGYLESRDDASR